MNGFTITRSIAAAPEKVWSAFTTADEYAAWVWPAQWGTTCSIDLKVGGEFRVAAAVNGFSVEGTYLEIEPITRLVMSWKQTNRDGESTLTILIEPAGEGTSLTLTQENFPDEASKQAHEAGWADCLGRLPGYLAAAQTA